MNDWHRGDWMETYTGRKFYPFDPKPEDIDIRDIAHALAMTCRYNGHTKFHYSVAQHSVLVARHVARGERLRALLHDAAEAYIGDMIRPLKKSPQMQTFLWLEAKVEAAIATKFDLPQPLCHGSIKEADNRILLDERAALLSDSGHDWAGMDGLEPLGVCIEEWSPKKAKREFMAAFYTHSQLDMFPEDA